MKEKKNRKIHPLGLSICLLLGVLFVLVLLNVFFGDHWIDSDMAAEMIFSKLIAEEGGLLTTKNWYYSTEFRVLYTQLFMVPLFHIFEDWHVIRTITNVLTYMLLLGSYYYFMKPLKVNRTAVVLSSIILLLPFSETFVTHMQMGNTYMPHVIIIFFGFGMFLRLTQQEKLLCFKNIFLLGCYILLSVVCGMSGVRYMLALQAPLVLTAVYYLFRSESFAKLRAEISMANVKKTFGEERLSYLVYSMVGAFSALAGYVINVAVIAKKYPFQTYDVTNFIKIFQGVLVERMQDTIANLLMLFGYIEERGFLSLRGVISLIAFALLIGIAVLTKRVGYLLKTADSTQVEALGHKRFIEYFFVIAFVLNTFVFVFTTSTIVSKDKNAEEKKVAAFLKENEYSFGYASYWNANIMTELTDGSVEVANILNFADMSYFRWSSPMKYYEEGYHEGKTFLLMEQEEYGEYANLPVVAEGEVVYEDDTYVVLHYDAKQQIFGEK